MFIWQIFFCCFFRFGVLCLYIEGFWQQYLFGCLVWIYVLENQERVKCFLYLIQWFFLLYIFRFYYFLSVVVQLIKVEEGNYFGWLIVLVLMVIYGKKYCQSWQVCGLVVVDRLVNCSSRRSWLRKCIKDGLFVYFQGRGGEGRGGWKLLFVRVYFELQLFIVIKNSFRVYCEVFFVRILCFIVNWG